MDELVFRTSEAFNSLQHRIAITAGEGKTIILHTTERISEFLLQLFNNERLVDIKEAFVQHLTTLATQLRDFQNYVIENHNPRDFIENLITLTNRALNQRDILVGGTGILVGGIVGFYCAQLLGRKEVLYRCMQAVQCISYIGTEAAIVVDDVKGPSKCKSNEVLIDVKACSVNLIDCEICYGYGSTLRSLLRKYYKFCTGDLPVTLGRDCAGVVVDVGRDVTRIEIGDEVWGVSPFWAPGTMTEYVVLPEEQVSRKPKQLGFECAAGIPYCGGTALSMLDEIEITTSNARTKSIFIHGSCSAIGCILMQVLINWKAKVSVSCYKKSTPIAQSLGIHDIIELIPYSNETSQTKKGNMEKLTKELDMKEQFDVIITTVPCELNDFELKKYLKSDGKLITTIPKPLQSDKYGFLMGSIFSLHVKIKSSVQTFFNDRLAGYGEPRINYCTLDQLSNYVADGSLKAVIDSVYQPHDIERALNHIKSIESIGGTVISFR